MLRGISKKKNKYASAKTMKKKQIKEEQQKKR